MSGIYVEKNGMAEINIPREERDAIKAVDIDMLGKLIQKCLDEERSDALRILRLENCGLYTASRLQEYQNALAAHSKAKAAKKREATKYDARCSGSNLLHAVQQMKQQVETQEKEGLLFYVDDHIVPPYRFNERMTIRVSYHWRSKVEDEWIYGDITFSHEVDLRPDYTMPLPKRKPSIAKQEQDRQEKLSREWEHLLMLGLHSVREYFRKNGNGEAIPKMFQAKTDSYNKGLNNYSTQFWQP